MSASEGTIACRLPKNSHASIRLGHGSGGRLSSELLQNVFLKHLNDSVSCDDTGDDAAVFQLGTERIAITTDSYVVQPIVFPGGNIGTLAVNGTINDLAMRGAVPSHITAAFILEEGFALSELETIVASMADACKQHGVQFTSGDTKVVNKGAGDKIFITTTGIGRVVVENVPSCRRAAAGDVIIVSGELGRHGTAIMCARESLKLEVNVTSDCAALHTLVAAMLNTSKQIHCLRDVTRGGLSTVLNELACSSNVGIEIRESDVPIDPQVRSVCELLGLDPFYVACEGRLVCIVAPEDANLVLSCMQDNELATKAAIIGKVTSDHPGRVVCESMIGGRRILDKLSGEQLPRIC